MPVIIKLNLTQDQINNIQTTLNTNSNLNLKSIMEKILYNVESYYSIGNLTSHPRTTDYHIANDTFYRADEIIRIKDPKNLYKITSLSNLWPSFKWNQKFQKTYKNLGSIYSDNEQRLLKKILANPDYEPNNTLDDISDEVD